MVRTEIIQDGMVISVYCENEHEDHCDNNYPNREKCTWEGVRQCARHSIYEEMNTLEKLACSLAGFACVEEQLFMCAAENCAGL